MTSSIAKVAIWVHVQNSSVQEKVKQNEPTKQKSGSGHSDSNSNYN